MSPRTDILAAIMEWLAATPLNDGGDESRWNARCPATNQGLGGTMVGPRRRTSLEVLAVDPTREQRAIEHVAVDVILALAESIAWHASPPERQRAVYDIRPIGPVVELTRLGFRGETMALDTAAIVAAGAAIEQARATAPIGRHLGTDRGRQRDLAAAASGDPADMGALLRRAVDAYMGREKISQAEVARRAGLEPASLNRSFKRPDAEPPTVRAICKLIGLRVALVPDEG